MDGQTNNYDGMDSVREPFRSIDCSDDITIMMMI